MCGKKGGEYNGSNKESSKETGKEDRKEKISYLSHVQTHYLGLGMNLSSLSFAVFLHKYVTLL